MQTFANNFVGKLAGNLETHFPPFHPQRGKGSTWDSRIISFKLNIVALEQL